MALTHGTTVTVHRAEPGGVDQHGDPIAGSSTSHDIENCGIGPRPEGDIDARNRAGVIVGWNLFAPYNADILATDRIEINGELFDVEGVPGRWASPLTGREHGMQVALKRPEG